MTPGMDRPPEVQRAIDTPRSQGNPDTALGYIYTRFIFQEFLQELKSAAVDSRSDIRHRLVAGQYQLRRSQLAC